MFTSRSVQIIDFLLMLEIIIPNKASLCSIDISVQLMIDWKSQI